MTIPLAEVCPERVAGLQKVNLAISEMTTYTEMGYNDGQLFVAESMYQVYGETSQPRLYDKYVSYCSDRGLPIRDPGGVIGNSWDHFMLAQAEYRRGYLSALNEAVGLDLPQSVRDILAEPLKQHMLDESRAKSMLFQFKFFSSISNFEFRTRTI